MWAYIHAGCVAAQVVCVSLKSPCISAVNEEGLASVMALTYVVSAVF